MINVELFNFINGLAGKSPFLDSLMVFSAKYVVALIPIFFVYVFLKSKKKALFVFLSVLISVLLSKLIGFLVYSPRPFALSLGTQLVDHVADASFPSDHAITFFAFGFALLFIKYKKLGIGFFLLGGFVGFARIFTGIHFPSDILGSLMLSLLIVTLFYLFLRKFNFVGFHFG